MHYWADLQSVHGFRCYDNIAPNAKCQRVLVLALCLVQSFIQSVKPISQSTNIDVIMSTQYKDSSADEIANVNFFYDDIVHVEASAYAH